MHSGLRTFLKYVIIFVIAFLPVELTSYVAGRILAQKGLIYIPVRPADYARYLADRDVVLGWPSPKKRGVAEVDTSGARISPAFPDPGLPSCVALFGDSFTWGADVDPVDAYGNVLAQRLGCRVSNFGVPGYGTDQAVLRYEQIRPAAPVVVLGHYADNIIRNVNQNRDFLSNLPFGLKPRFVIDNGGSLHLIPLPTLTQKQYFDLDEKAGELLPFEWHFPGGPSGLVTLRFPFTLSILRALGHYRILSVLLDRQPSYNQFYRPEHPSGALVLTVAIMKRFIDVAKRRHQHPIIVLIPDVKDFEMLRRGHSLGFDKLRAELKKQSIEALSLVEPLNEYLGTRPAADLYAIGHFNPEGYRQVALIVESEIRRRGLLAPGH